MTNHDVFISYSTRDLSRMLDIYADLRMQGLSVWIDKQGIIVGASSWRDAIADALKATRCVIVLLSPHSAKSFWVKQELAFAEMHNIRIFPVLLQGEPKDAVPFGFMLSQWVDVRTTDDMLRLQLFPELAKHLGKPLPDRANIPTMRAIREETETVREIEQTTRAAREAVEHKQQAESSSVVRELRAEADRKAKELEDYKRKFAEEELTQQEHQRIQDLEHQLGEAQKRIDLIARPAGIETDRPLHESPSLPLPEKPIRQSEQKRGTAKGNQQKRTNNPVPEQAASPDQHNPDPKSANSNQKVDQPHKEPMPVLPSPVPVVPRESIFLPPGDIDKVPSYDIPATVERQNLLNPLAWMLVIVELFTATEFVTSLVVWMPLLIPVFALATGVVPVSASIGWSRSLWIGTVVGFIATIWAEAQDTTLYLGYDNTKASIIVMIGVVGAGIAAGVVATGITGRLALVLGVTGITIFVASCGVFLTAETYQYDSKITTIGTFTVATALAMGLAFSVTGILLGVVLGVVAAGITLIVVFIGLKVVVFAIDQDSALLNLIMIVILGADYTILIWICWLGGWRVLAGG